MRTLVRSLSIALCAGLLLAVPATSHALFGGTLTASQCSAGKLKCVSKMKTCMVKCHQKSINTGLPVEAACLTKCRDKFDQDPAIPGKGCFAKLEAKGGCGASIGDSAVFAAKVEAQVTEAIAQLVPTGGNPLNKCSAGKINCLRKYGSCILNLASKAAKAGTAIGDTSKCTRYLDVAENSCVAKLEAKYCTPSIACDSTAPPCLSFDDAIALRNGDDAFTDDSIYALENGPADMNTQRCTGDTSVQCATAPGGVADCGGPLGTCEFFFSAPIPYTVVIPICVVRHWNGSISGTFDQATGESAGTAAVLSAIFTGNVDSPCPECQGDLFPNDGLAGGSCVGGARSGLACDGNGQSPEAAFGVTSLDCPPGGSPIDTLKLDFSNSTAGVTRTVALTSPNCSGAPGKKCLCGTCSGDPTIPCFDSAECALAGAGTCIGTGGEPQKPNLCIDDTSNPGDGSLCVPVGNGEGMCPEGPLEQHCVMESFRSCTVQTENVDCPLPGDSCGMSPRECFPGYDGVVGDTITAAGEPGDLRNGATPMALGSVFCVAPTMAPAVNAAAGYPGPGRLQLTGVGTDNGGPACPTEASFLPTNKHEAMDSGWTGFSHDLKAVGQAKITVATACTGTYPSCQCSYTGPIPNPDAP